MNLPPYPNETPSDWQGMTLQQIQMRRTLVQARMEIQKFKMSAQIDRYRRRSPVFGAPDSLFSRITGALTLAEYGFIAIKAFRFVAPLFRRRKKKQRFFIPQQVGARLTAPARRKVTFNTRN